MEGVAFWQEAARAIVEAMSGNPGAILDSVSSFSVADLSRTAVACNDLKPRAPIAVDDIVDTTLAITANTTRFAFQFLTGGPWTWQGCEFWPYEVPQPFYGPFNTSPKNPILIISNTVCDSGFHLFAVELTELFCLFRLTPSHPCGMDKWSTNVWPTRLHCSLSMDRG